MNVQKRMYNKIPSQFFLLSQQHHLSGNFISVVDFELTVYRTTRETRDCDNTFDVEWDVSHRYGLAAAVSKGDPFNYEGVRYLFSFAGQLADCSTELSETDYDDANAKIYEFNPADPKPALWEIVRGYLEENYDPAYFGDL